jgi:acyl carrier protein
MTDYTQLHQRLIDLFANTLNLEVSSVETDLVESGLLDSLTLVELFLSLEQEFGVRVSLDDLAIDSFRSVASIAQFIAQQGTQVSQAYS